MLPLVIVKEVIMNHTNNTLIPERLKSARERLNLSKAEAARRIGLTAASYVRYEAGDRRPSPQVILSIAEKMNTSVPYLSGETDDISPDVINIHKKSDPTLFELIKNTQSADDTTLQRLLSYYHQLTKND
ncbi:MAG: helix-turn-helix transcriptional regulator [Lachnospiraceae bacterium]|nr:helix-turn-helix transcriptional regulator [Lachnospiraceae bacterium]